MGLKGDLTTFSLADIFQTLSLSQKEGTLYVVHDERRKTIYFGPGGLRLLQVGNRATPLLGDLLVRSGVITQGLLDSALKQQRITKQKLGEVLVDLGFVSQDQLDKIVRTQIEEEVYDLFWWKDASFEFVEGPPPPELTDPTSTATSIDLDVNGLLFEAARRLDEWARMVQVITDFQEVYCTGGRARGAIANGQIAVPAEVEVLNLADGSRTVLELIAASSLGRFETCRVLFQTIGEGKIFPAATDELKTAAEKLRSAGEKERALRLAMRAVDRTPQDLGSLRLAASLEIETGDLKSACDHLRAAADVADKGGNVPLTVQILEQALKCDPNALDVQLGLFKRYASLNQTEKAGRTAVPLMHGLVAAQRWREAADLHGEAVRFVADPMDLHLLHARARMELNERDLAADALNSAYHSGKAPAAMQGDVFQQRLQNLCPSAPELHALAKETRIRRRKRAKLPPWLVPAAVGAAVLLLGGLGAFAVFGNGDKPPTPPPVIEPTPELLAAKAEAERLERERKEAEERARLEKEEAERQAKLRAEREEKERLEREDRERLEREEQARLAREEAERQEREKMQARFREGCGLEVSGPDLEKARDVFVEVETWARGKGDAELERQARERVDKAEAALAQARALSADAARELAAGKLDEAYRLVHRLWKEFPFTPAARAATLPIKVVTFPPGASAKLGTSDMGRTPAVVQLPFQVASATLWMESPGFLPAKVEVTPESPPTLTFHLEKVVHWRLRTKGAIEARPVPVGDRLLVASRDGRVYAASRDKGETAWVFAADTSGDVIAPPTVHGDSLYVGSNDHRLYRVGLADGKKRWEYATGLFVQGTPLVLDEPALVIVGSHDQKLHAVKRESGEAAWTSPAGGPVTAGPVSWNGQVLFGAGDGNLHAVEAAKGKAQWQVACGGDLAAPIVIAGDVAYAATKAGALHAVDLKGRKLAWTAETGGAVFGAPALDGERVLVGTLNGHLHAFARVDGKPAWTFAAEGAIGGGAAVADGKVYFGARDGWIYVLDAASGALEWRLQARGPVNGTPLVHEGTLYIGSDDGQLYAIRLAGS